MMDVIVDANDVAVVSGRVGILESVTLQVADHTVAAIIGRPGSGKSIFLKTLVGQRPRVRGRLQVCGYDPSEQPKEVRRRTTYVANPDVFEPHLPARANVRQILRLSGVTPPDARELDRVLRDAEVPDRDLDRCAQALSPGVLFSLWLAIARLRASALVLLDDPTMYVSRAETSHLAHRLREVASRGPTVVIATSDVTFGETVADAVYALDAGRSSPMPRPTRSPPMSLGTK